MELRELLTEREAPGLKVELPLPLKAPEAEALRVPVLELVTLVVTDLETEALPEALPDWEALPEALGALEKLPEVEGDRDREEVAQLLMLPEAQPEAVAQLLSEGDRVAVRLEELLAVPVALPEELRVPVPLAEGEPEPVSSALMLLLRVGLLLLQELAEELPEALEQELWLAEPE